MDPTRIETETRLIAPDPAALDGLGQALGELAGPGGAVRDRGTIHIHDTYLDTPDWWFYRAGLACRIRRQAAEAAGGRARPTEQVFLAVKQLAPAVGGVAVRIELEERLDRLPSLRPRRIPGRALGRQLRELLRTGWHDWPARAGGAGRSQRRLRTLFEVFNRRHVYDVEFAPGPKASPPVCVQVCADRVTFHANGRSPTAAEVELEAVRGGAYALEGLAGRLARRLGLADADSSKFRRGLDLAGLSPPSAPSAVAAGEPVRPDDRTVDVAHRVLSGQLDRLAWHEPGTRMGLDPEYCHQMRVATRRMRAALRLFAPALGKRTADSLRRRLALLADALGRVRDLDVYLEDLPGYAAHLVRRSDDSPTLRPYRAYLEGERRRARADLLAALDSKAAAHLLGRLRSLLAAGPPSATRRPVARAPIAAFARRAIRKGLKRVKKQGRAAGPDAPDQALHRLRLSIKRLRYTCEFVAPLLGKPGRRLIRRLTRLQDALGQFQDATIAGGLLERFAASVQAADPAADVLLDLGQLIAWQHSRRLAARAEFARRWRKFDRRKVRRPVLKRLVRLRPDPDPAPGLPASAEQGARPPPATRHAAQNREKPEDPQVNTDERG